MHIVTISHNVLHCVEQKDQCAGVSMLDDKLIHEINQLNEKIQQIQQETIDVDNQDMCVRFIY